MMNQYNFTQKNEWKTNKIKAAPKGGAYILWIFSLLWCAISLPIALMATPALLAGQFTAGIAYLFPIIGIGLIIFLIKLSLNYRRYGILEFEMDPFPGSMGGDVGGSILVKNLPYVGTEFKVVLSCWRNHENKETRSVGELIWSQSGVAQANVENGGIRLKFCFQPPEHLPESETFSSDYHSWDLKLNAKTKGVDLNQCFDIPVFKTQQKSRLFLPNTSEQNIQTETRDAKSTIALLRQGETIVNGAGRKIRYSNHGTKNNFIFYMKKGWGFTLFLALFAAGLAYSVHYMLYELSDESIGAWLLSLISNVFVLIVSAFIILVLFMAFNSLKVAFNRNGISTARRWLLLPFWMKKVNYRNIESIKRVSDLSMYSQCGEETNYFKILLSLKGGNVITVAQYVQGEKFSEQLMQFYHQLISPHCANCKIVINE